MDLKPAYSLSEFATMLGEPVTTVRKRASRGAYPTELVGGKRFIFLADLREVFPRLWESILQVSQLKRAAVGGDTRGQTATGKRRQV